MMGKILVVDDTPANISLLKYLLQENGYEVLVANDGQEALEVITSDVDAVIMDVMMPRMNGIEATAEIKANPKTQHIPVAILTAKKTTTKDKIEGLNLGADEYFTKPIDTKELLARLDLLIRTHSAQRSLNKTNEDLRAKNESSEQKIEKLKTLNEISTSISATLDLNKILEITISKLVELMRVEQATLIFVDRKLQRGHIRTAYDSQQKNPPYLDSYLDLTKYPAIKKALSTGKPFIVPKKNKIHIVTDGQKYEEEINSNEVTLILPLIIRGQHLGVITLKGRRTKSTYDKDEIEFCQAIAHQTAIAIDKATIFDNLREKHRELKKIDKMKDDLVNMVIHDLRTPLTSVIGYLDIVLSGMAGEINSEQEDCLERALESSQWLLKMINDLLDVTKFEEGKIKLGMEPSAIGDVIDAAVSQVIGTARSDNIEIKVMLGENLPLISIDFDKILRTLVNLMGNAIKFSEENSVVEIHAELLEEDEQICLSVKDYGRGIPKEHFQTIFEKFGQLESRPKGQKYSTGLGLTFCKLAVEAHLGKIWVESELGRGSTFYLTLPISSD